MFSKACQYGIKALIYLSQQSKDGKRVRVDDIAKATNSPKAFTAKILQQLARNKIIRSLKGPYGGFEIEEERLETLRLVDIVYAIDSEEALNQCGLGLKVCDPTQPCPIHHEYAKIKSSINHMLETMLFKELAMKYEEGDAVLKIK